MIENIFSQFDQILTTNQFAQGGFIIAVASWLFYQLKSVPLLIYNSLIKLFVFRVEIAFDHEDKTYEYFSKWYVKNFPSKFNKTVAKINFERSADPWDYEYVTRTKKLVLDLFQGSDNNFIYYKGRFLSIRKIRAKLEHANNSGDIYSNEYIITGLFARKQIMYMLNEILEEKQKELSSSTGISLITSSGLEKKHSILTIFKNFDQLFFQGKSELINYLDNWNQRKLKSKSMGILHKTGISLFGPPGTGKTSIAKAIAHRYGLTLVMINLANFKSDDDLINFISVQAGDSVFLLEDVDDFLGKVQRSKLNGKSNISFSCVLQILDGIYSPNNSIFILTTNHEDELDPSVYRDGRINYRANITYPSNSEIKEFIESYFGQEVGDTYNFHPDLSMATVEQTILRTDSIESCLSELIN